MGRTPLPWNVTPNGAWGVDRGDRRHTGVDLGAPAGTAVLAPEDGEVAMVVAREPGDELPQPWRGYGPGVVVLAGASGRYHVLAHLEDDDLRARWPWLDALDPTRTIRQQIGQANIKVAGLFSVPRVSEGDIVGQVGGLRHLHWEVRKQSMLGGRYDPQVWARQYAWGRDARVTLEPHDALTVIVLGLLAGAILRRRR